MDQRYAAGQRVAIIGILANLFLLCGKLSIGYIYNSQGMVADGFNSMGDVLASLITMLGSRLAARPADGEHPYGHGKAEYLATAAIALLIGTVGVFTAKNAIESMTAHKVFIFSPLLPIMAGITICVKGTLYFVTSRIGREFNSLIILANSEDHRNDVFLSAGMLAGILGGLLGVWWLDGVMGVLISAWLILVALRLMKASLSVLMDTVIDPEVVDHLRGHILEKQGVLHVDSITSKPVGARCIIIVRVSVPGEMTVLESHKIAELIRTELRSHREIADVVVHINPDTAHGDDD